MPPVDFPPPEAPYPYPPNRSDTGHDVEALPLTSSSRWVALAAGAAGLLLALLTGVLVVHSVRARAPKPVATTVASAPPSAGEVPSAVVTAPPPAPPSATDEDSAPPPAVASATTSRGQLATNEAELNVLCEPLPCEVVMLDGKSMTEYPGPAIVRPGPHGIGISRRGYYGQWQRAVLTAGQRRTVRFTLAPAAPKPCAKGRPCN
jgi:hypothetical protein